MVVSAKVHTLGKSYGVGESTYSKNGTINESPNTVANEDIQTYNDVINKTKNKKGKPLNKKEMKKLKDSKECIGKMKRKLDAIKDKDHDDQLEQTIINAKNCKG